MTSKVAAAAARSLLTRHSSIISSSSSILRSTRTTGSPRTTVGSSFSFSTAPAPASASASAKNPTAGQTLGALAGSHPHTEVIRYHHKNVKWTLAHVDYFAEALAIGLLENGLEPGDAVLSWLPSHFSEQHILQFACSKSGLVLYHLDPAKAVDDPASAETSLAKALELSEATCLITQDVGSGFRYVDVVKKVIPEIRIFAWQDGNPFFTPRFPHLRFPIHVGFDDADQKYGLLLYKQMLSPSGKLGDILEECGDVGELDGDTALSGSLTTDADGVPTAVGKTLSNDEVLESGMWPEINSILDKKYSEVEGVGVIF